MNVKNICSRCKTTGTKLFIPYKVIHDDGESIKYIGSLCENCYKEIFDNSDDRAPSTENENEDNSEENEPKK